MPTDLSITATPHWFNGWFLRLLATPVIRVAAMGGSGGSAGSNGRRGASGSAANDQAYASASIDRPARWGRAETIDVEPGSHAVSVGARYRGTRAVLGAEKVVIHVGAGERVNLTARNGPLNHQPFVVRAAR